MHARRVKGSFSSCCCILLAICVMLDRRPRWMHSPDEGMSKLPFRKVVQVKKSLHLVSPVSSTEMIYLLLRVGSPVNQQCNVRKWTALHYAVYAHQIRYAKVLLESGASTTLKDQAGRTPTELSRQCKCSKQMQRLLELQEKRQILSEEKWIPLALPPFAIATTCFLATVNLPHARRCKPIIALILIISLIFLVWSKTQMAGSGGVARQFFPLIARSYCFWNALALLVLCLSQMQTAGYLAVLLLTLLYLIGILTSVRMIRSAPGYVTSTDEDFKKLLDELGNLPFESCDQPPYEYRNFQRSVCFKCGLRTLEATHCKICDRCVSHFVKHSSWLHKCVGKRNHQNYLYSTAVHAMFHMCVALIIAFRLRGSAKPYSSLIRIALFDSLLMSCVFTNLTIRHCYQTDMTMSRFCMRPSSR